MSEPDDRIDYDDAVEAVQAHCRLFGFDTPTLRRGPGGFEYAAPGVVAHLSHQEGPVVMDRIYLAAKSAAAEDLVMFYSRSGFRTEPLGERIHPVLLWDYDDHGKVSPANGYARNLLARQEQEQAAAEESGSVAEPADRRGWKSWFRP